MTSEQLSSEVVQIEDRISQMRAQLDTMLEATRPEIASKAVTWIDAEVARKVQEYASTIQSLGVDKVRAMKVRVEETKRNVPSVVTARTNERERWPHHVSPRSKTDGRGEEEGFFLSVFRHAISTLGPVLYDFGLTSVAQGKTMQWRYVAAGIVTYAISPVYSGGPLVDAYAAEHLKLLELQKHLGQKQAALAKAQAQELYDQA